MRARSAPSFEIQVDEVGPSLKYATAKVTRTQRSGGSSYGGGQQGGGQSSAPADNDPWATPQGGGAPQGGGSGGGAPANDPWATPGVSNDEPPF